MIIHKQILQITDQQSITVPSDAQFLSVQNQKDQLTIWYEFSNESPETQKEIFILGTGNETPVEWGLKHLGTVQMGNGVFVWHVFAKDW